MTLLAVWYYYDSLAVWYYYDPLPYVVLLEQLSNGIWFIERYDLTL